MQGQNGLSRQYMLQCFHPYLINVIGNYYLLNFADPCRQSIFVVWWSCFISRRKAVLLTFWKFGNTTFCWCCLRIWWGDAVMGWRDRENPGKVSFVRQGALGTLREVTRLDYTRKWYSLMMISRTENRVWKQCAVQDFFARDEAPQPQDGSKFIGKSGSKQAGTLGGVSNSLPCIPSIPMYSRTWHLTLSSEWKIVLLWTRINVLYLI